MLMTVTDWLWSYVLIGALLIVGARFTLGSRGVQVRLFRRTFAVLANIDWRGSDRGISSFQALAVSIAGRVGGGNIAGVAVAITLGGPGALFWMWLIALLGMATSLFECALAQLYKRRNGEETFRGGPAYVMRHGLGWRVLPVIYSLLLLITIGFGFNAVQSYVVTASIESAFGVPAAVSGVVMTGVMAVILFGGIRRLALVSEIVVPAMVLGYLALALIVLILNFALAGRIFRIRGSLPGYFRVAFWCAAIRTSFLVLGERSCRFLDLCEHFCACFLSFFA